MIINRLVELLGPIPEDKSEFTRRMRIHQGWWRMVVLGEEAGPRPNSPEQTVCNTINGDEDTHKNLLTANAWEAYLQTSRNRDRRASGIVEKKRLLNNLLSSQPLCFNCFGELKLDLTFAAEVLRTWIPDIRRVTQVQFEYGLQNEAFDKSAFDVAFLFEADQGRGLFGLECKYTDHFSDIPKRPKRYYELYKRHNEVFQKPFESYQNRDYNQLFRNQLLLQELIRRKEIDFGITGIFCHHDDTRALKAAGGFQRYLLRNGQDRFRIITIRDYISSMQRRNIHWERREWTMLLWARYCGLDLSKRLKEMV